MRRLLAFSILTAAAAPASAFQYPATALGEDAAAIHRAMPSVTTGVTGGVNVGRDFAVQLERQFGGPRSVPISARVRVPNAAVSARSAALCFAFPPRCIGTIALGLVGSELLVDAAGALIRRYQAPVWQCILGNRQAGEPFSVNLPLPACEKLHRDRHYAVVPSHAGLGYTYGWRTNDYTEYTAAGCCCRPKVDQPYRLKIDQGWKPRAVALGAFGL